MSRTENHIGTIKIVLNKPTEKQIYHFFKSMDKEDKINMTVEDDGLSCFISESCYYLDMCNKYVYIDGDLYEVNGKESEEGFCSATRIDDETFSYSLNFYNGGCSFDEALESAVISAKKGNKDE